MAQKTGNIRKSVDKEKEEQERQAVRAQRREFEAELAEHYAQRPRRPRNRRRIVLLSVLAVLVVLAGLYTVLIMLPTQAQTPTAGIAVGKAAPDFSLPVYGGGEIGKTISLKALRGHPVVLNFWSESCEPCRSEVPLLQRTYAQYGTGPGASSEFVLLGINQADPRDDIASFGQQFKVTYPLLFDKGGATSAAYNVTAIPTTYFIDTQGIVRAVSVTELTPQTLQKGLASLGVLIA